MVEREIFWQDVVKIWWAFTWRATLGSFCLGFLAGLLAGFVGAAVAAEAATIQSVGRIAGALIWAIWSVFALRLALRTKYRDFRIILVSHGDAGG